MEDLLATEYRTYRNAKGDEVVRAVEYSLPAHLHENIDTIQPTNHFSLARSVKSTLPARNPVEARDVQTQNTKSPPSYTDLRTLCNATDGGLTIRCLRTLYKTIDYKPQVPHKNYAGIAAYLNDTVSPIKSNRFPLLH